jgi:penicillin-binding protein 2
VAIGQGYVTTTPLQLANMMAAVGNGGKLFRPYLVRKVESLDGAAVREYGPHLIRTIEMKPDTINRVQKALADVVHGPGGTGGAARSPVIQVAGKTGTAQVIEMKGAYLKSEQLSYFNRDHAWFVSYAPVENPQIAIAVLVEHGGHGGEAAAPMAKKVFEKFIARHDPPAEKREVRAEGETRAN